MLFTFFSENRGSTYIDQVHGTTVRSALREWARRSSKRFGKSILKDMQAEAAVPIRGRRNVWCWTALDRKEKLVLVHIIQTAFRRSCEGARGDRRAAKNQR